MAKTATPTFSPVAGAYSSSQTVTISCATVPAAVIYYTTDGTTPAETGGTPTGTTQIYSSPLTIALGTTLKAIALSSGDTVSNTASGLYAQAVTISGSLGTAGAGAKVFFLAGTALKGTATADGSGNFTSPSIAGSTSYQVVPAAWQVGFTPGAQTVVTTNANVTGVTFTAAALLYNVLGSDDCNRADENPLSDGGNWVTPVGGIWSPLKLASKLIQQVAAESFSGSGFTGFTWPADCWQTVVVDAGPTTNNDFIQLYLRTSILGVGPNAQVSGSSVVLESSSVSGSIASAPITVHAADALTFVVVGTIAMFFQNQVPLIACTIATTTGAQFLELDVEGGSVTLGAVTAWSGGSVTTAANPDDPTLPYIGCVSLAGSDTGGSQYVGHVRVIGTARAGAPNPYLGKMFVASAPPGPGDPFIGEVTVVSGPPSGSAPTDTYLGHMNKT